MTTFGEWDDDLYDPRDEWNEEDESCRLADLGYFDEHPELFDEGLTWRVESPISRYL